MDPGIIVINKGGYCKDCPFMDLQTHKIYSGDDLCEETVECFHHDICDRVYHNIVMSFTEGVEGNDSQKVH